jgi:hypothetical protein
MSATQELAAIAARLVAEEGMEYAAAKRKAHKSMGDFGRRVELPSHEELEDAVREHIDLFCAETQPTELRALREVAATWMQRLAEFRPHLSGAVWRGTATRWSAVRLDLYCDDPKAAEIALINAGVNYDSGMLDRPGRPGGEPLNVLSLASTCRALGEAVTVHLLLHDLDPTPGAATGAATWRPCCDCWSRTREPSASDRCQRRRGGSSSQRGLAKLAPSAGRTPGDERRRPLALASQFSAA